MADKKQVSELVQSASTYTGFLKAVLNADYAVRALKEYLKYNPSVSPKDYKLMEEVGSLFITVGIFLLEHRRGE